MWPKFIKWVDQQLTMLFFINQFESHRAPKYIARLFLLVVFIPILMLYLVFKLIGG
jgi:hypothetical protein